VDDKDEHLRHVARANELYQKHIGQATIDNYRADRILQERKAIEEDEEKIGMCSNCNCAIYPSQEYMTRTEFKTNPPDPPKRSSSDQKHIRCIPTEAQLKFPENKFRAEADDYIMRDPYHTGLHDDSASESGDSIYAIDYDKIISMPRRNISEVLVLTIRDINGEEITIWRMYDPRRGKDAMIERKRQKFMTGENLQYMHVPDLLTSCINDGTVAAHMEERTTTRDPPEGKTSHPHHGILGDGGPNWEIFGPAVSARQKESIKDEQAMQKRVKETMIEIKCEVYESLTRLASPLEFSDHKAEQYMTNTIRSGLASKDFDKEKKYLKWRMHHSEERVRDWKWSINDLHEDATRIYGEEMLTTNVDQEIDIQRLENMYSNIQESINREKHILKRQRKETSKTLRNMENLQRSLHHIRWVCTEKELHQRHTTESDEPITGGL
jgi:hypothetical protein